MSDSGRLSVFDFDDCAYGTATHDVAIVLFYWLMGAEEDLASEIARFMGPFMSG